MNLSDIRSKIKSQVEDCIWLEDLREHFKLLKERVIYRETYRNRCIKCTLPLGTCPHTKNWEKECGPLSKSLNNKKKSDNSKTFKFFEDEESLDNLNKSSSPIKDRTSEEMDELFDVLNGGVQINTTAQKEDVDIERIKWYQFVPRLSDKIGDKYLSISVPPPRGWHTMINMDRFLIVYGGFRFHKSKTPQPFFSSIKHDEVEYLSDIYIYDTQNLSWHNPMPEGVIPPGRYGHCAANLDGQRMVIFGGRGTSGKFYQDTWVFDIALNKWFGPLYGDDITPCPSPRCFSAAISAGNHRVGAGRYTGRNNATKKIYLFGGTDGMENYGDLWILSLDSSDSFKDISDLRWERAVAVGPTPSPRYGHRIIGIGNDQFAVLGGCIVSPHSEVINPASDLTETQALFKASDALMAAYKAETDVPTISGKALYKSQSNILDQFHQASTTAGVVQHLEAETRVCEDNIADLYFKSESKKKFAMSKAKHPLKHIDITFLNVHDMTWSKSALGAKSFGTPPSSRMHFSACFIGHYILIIGGCPPTSLSFKTVDSDYSRLYALDTYTNTWLQPRPVDTSGYFDEPIHIADSDIMRARSRCEEEKMRGMSIGVKNGLTPELAEAEAVLTICKWRKRMLEKEKSEFCLPPTSRWGNTLCETGQRAILLGGWGSDRICEKDESFMIDLEPELEKNRRLQDEFEAKLERDRLAEESANLADNISSAYEIRARMAAEKADQARERELMAIEEIRCCVPPISKPPPVRFLKASHNCIWVEWDPVEKNSNGDLLTPEWLDKVKYLLWMKGGYQRILEGDRVIARVPKKEKEDNKALKNALKKSNKGSNMSSNQLAIIEEIEELTDDEGDTNDGGGGGGSRPSSSQLSLKDRHDDYSSSKFVDLHGEIAVARMNGLFDISFDDGSFESNIPRRRIRLELATESKAHQMTAFALMKSKERRFKRERFSRKHREREAKKAEDAKLLAQRAKKLGLTLLPKKQYQKGSKAIKKPSSFILAAPKFNPTITVGPEWQLVYSGKETAYSCTGLVPDVALTREIPEPRPKVGPLATAPIFPTTIAEVEFSLQIVGIDYPIEESSRMSDPVKCRTYPQPLIQINEINDMYIDDNIESSDLFNSSYDGDSQSDTKASKGDSSSNSKIKKVKLKSILLVAEDDIPDKSILLKVEEKKNDKTFKLKVSNKLQLEDEWNAEENMRNSLSSKIRSELALKINSNEDSLAYIISSARLRQTSVTVTKIGVDTVVGEGISHEYV